MKLFLREIHPEYLRTQTLKQPMEMAPGLLAEETNITVNHFELTASIEQHESIYNTRAQNRNY